MVWSVEVHMTRARLVLVLMMFSAIVASCSSSNGSMPDASTEGSLPTGATLPPGLALATPTPAAPKPAAEWEEARATDAGAGDYPPLREPAVRRAVSSATPSRGDPPLFPSASLISATIAPFAGVATPCFSPSRTISPLR